MLDILLENNVQPNYEKHPRSSVVIKTLVSDNLFQLYLKTTSVTPIQQMHRAVYLHATLSSYEHLIEQDADNFPKHVAC